MIKEQVLLGIVLFFYLSIWALIRPPFQSPDEYSHYTRVVSISENLFIIPGLPLQSFITKEGNINPLYYDETLRALPHNPQNKISTQKLAGLLSITNNKSFDYEVKLETATYPPLYYMLIHFLQYCIGVDNNNSYVQFLYLRIISCFITTIFWLVVYSEFRISDLPLRMYYWMLLNSMLAFISSGINPDAIIIPLGTLVMLRILKVFKCCSFNSSADLWIAIILACYTKPAGLLFFPASFLTLIIFSRNCKFILTNLILSICSFLLVYFGILYWNPPAMLPHGGVASALSLFEYLNDITYRAHTLVIEYWGALGWLDYSLGYFLYLIVFLLTVYGIFTSFKVSDTLRSLQVFTVIFVLGLFAIEYHWFDQVGKQIQGRYILPVSLGIATCVYQRRKYHQKFFILTLATIQILLINETINRYYSDGWVEFLNLINYLTRII